MQFCVFMQIPTFAWVRFLASMWSRPSHQSSLAAPRHERFSTLISRSCVCGATFQRNSSCKGPSTGTYVQDSLVKMCHFANRQKSMFRGGFKILITGNLSMCLAILRSAYNSRGKTEITTATNCQYLPKIPQRLQHAAHKWFKTPQLPKCLCTDSLTRTPFSSITSHRPAYVRHLDSSFPPTSNPLHFYTRTMDGHWSASGAPLPCA